MKYPLILKLVLRQCFKDINFRMRGN